MKLKIIQLLFITVYNILSTIKIRKYTMVSIIV